MIPYGVRREDEVIDYDELARLAEEHRPKLIIAGGSAYPRIIDFARFRADRRLRGRGVSGGHGALLGTGSGGVASEPLRYADIVTSTTHKTLRGPRSGIILAKAKYGPAIDKSVFPGFRAARWCTSSRPRPSASPKR